MIATLTGTVEDLRPTDVVINVNGVGYQCAIPLSTYEALRDAPSALLYVHTLHREDQFRLFGFFTRRERELFAILLNVAGIGPALALSIISSIDGEALVAAVRDGEPAMLTSVPGVGKAKAEKLIFELRRKLARLESFSREPARTPTVSADALDALVSLGIDSGAAAKLVEGIVREKPDISLEDVIKSALRKPPA
ncbi:MAG TPA: Holliday junction branch migration protein RuvA [Spirochaetota bacterium]|nr:Holliday junction branch migration protein RuvA [Spirochaetota bacterium]HNT09299.1 Holliday junction branch migration protein RuvA [Spirochaetota bacterium]